MVFVPHTRQSGQHKQINKQMLERMRRKGNPSALLVGMQTGAATVENRQGEGKNSVGNVEAKELISMTPGHEL